MKTLLFDLDGTLVNSAKGIIASFQAAMEQGGHPVPDAKDLNWIIGPPLRLNFEKALKDPKDVPAGVAAYRKIYGAGGMFDAEVYVGIKDALTALKAQGYQMFVCTAKPRSAAVQIIEHFELAEFFTYTYGPSDEGRFEDKADLIAHILTERDLQPQDAVMIGDHGNDTRSAQRNGMRSIGVLWGFGSEEELRDGGAQAMCPSPAELQSTIETVFQDTDA